MNKGISLSLTASFLFGLMYYYVSLLSPLDGEQIFGWRVLLTVPIFTLLMLAWGEWGQISNIVTRVQKEPALWVVLPLSSALLGVQLWLFMWAPLNNKALDVSTGYFMLPLIMLLIGRFLHKDSLSTWQKAAAFCALIGVSHEVFVAGGFSWASLVVALGYPLYFILRKYYKTDCLGGLWFDLLLMLPVACWFAFNLGEQGWSVINDHPRLYLLIPLLGVISSLALATYILSSRYLNLSLFGLLGYVEPVLLAFVSIILGERIEANDWFTYIPIWLAVGLLVCEGSINLLRSASKVRAV